MTEQQEILSELQGIKAMLRMATGRWLTLKEALAYSKKGKYALFNLVAEGKIKACKDGDGKTSAWIFDRVSIDTWRESQCVSAQVTDKAQEILSKLK